VAQVKKMVEEKEISPNALTHDNITPLFLATISRHREIVKYLLDKGSAPPPRSRVLSRLFASSLSLLPNLHRRHDPPCRCRRQPAERRFAHIASARSCR
jgi:ankyrin repeat protein